MVQVLFVSLYVLYAGNCSPTDLSYHRYDVINCVGGMVGCLVLVLTEAYIDNREGKNTNFLDTEN